MTQDPRRRIEIEGAYNVRDIGGYETADGRMTRWQMFLRADNVSTLPQHSQDTLTSTFGIRTVIDLRRQDEIDGQPDNVLARSPRVRYHNVDIVGDMVFDQVESTEPRERIHASYRNMLDRRGLSLARLCACWRDRERFRPCTTAWAVRTGRVSSPPCS